MNIVTIMNYDWKEKNNLKTCSIWIKQAKLWLTRFDTVYIYTRNQLPRIIKDQIDQSTTCTFKTVIYEEFQKNIPIHFAVSNKTLFTNHNFIFKLYVTSSISFPYLFLDSDAFIIDDIDELNQIFNQERDRVFFINHEVNIPKVTEKLETFINSGVFLMNDPHHLIYDWKQIYHFAKKKNFICKFDDGITMIPGSDQAIIQSYLDYIGYDYIHKNFNIQYNTSSFMINEWNRNGGRWQATLKNDPSTICKIVHYWGNNKCWDTNSCPLI